MAQKIDETKETKEVKEDVKKTSNRRPNRKQARAASKNKDFRKEVRKACDSAKNDIGWYSRYPAIYDAAANLVWSRPAGVTIHRGFETIAGGTLAAGNVSVVLPGILSLGMVHGIGNTNLTGTNAPVNISAKAIYTWVRHMNSGHANYDGPDLMLYLLAMNEAYAAISFIGRAFGTVAMYSGGNRLLPDMLFSMQGIDGQSIRDNFANFRARMNILIQKASSLVVPLGMDIFNRTSFLYANYYTEGESVKDQLYFMRPTGFRTFTRDASGAGMLEWHDISHWYSGGVLTWGSLCQIMEDILTPLIADEDINIMAGDLLKAYGDSGIQKLVFLPDLFIATPQKVEEVLWQIKNAKIVDGTVSNLDITQDGNHEYLIFEPTVTANASNVACNTADALLVTDEIPTKEINMINSRLAISADYGVYGAAPNAGIIICGSDFVREATYCYISGGSPSIKPYDRSYNVGAITSNNLVQLANAASFKYAPELTAVTAAGNVDDLNVFDFDDFTVVDKGTLTTLHDAAILSLFAVPHVGM